MFLKAKYIHDTDNQGIVYRKTLINIDRIEQIIYFEETQECEIYFKAVGADKQGQPVQTWCKVKMNISEISDVLDAHSLILKKP